MPLFEKVLVFWDFFAVLFHKVVYSHSLQVVCKNWNTYTDDIRKIKRFSPEHGILFNWL